MVAIKGKKSSNKNPPILSHEFVIQNHADIVSCVAMVFVIGLMVQATSPWAYIFIALHHNVSSMNSTDNAAIQTPIHYTVGWKDICAVFFYFLITIVMHAVVQEYIFDKISKKQKLSKTKLSKFNESCQLILFYVLSAAWGIDIIVREKMFLNIPKLWTEYPAPMSFSLKFFFIAQIAYWLHSYPELYFQRVKKEEILNRVVQATIGLVFTSGAYILNFQQVGLSLLVLHYVGEGLLHLARLIHFLNHKENVSKIVFSISNFGFIAARLATVGLSALVFFYGLGQVKNSLDVATGNFNIPAIRYSALAAIVLFQVYMSYNVLKRVSSYAKTSDTPTTTKVKVQKPKKKKEASKKSEKSGGSEDESSGENPTRKSLRLRSTPKTK